MKFFNSALLNSQHSGCMASTEHCCRMAPGTKWEIFSYWHPQLELTLAWWAWGTGKAGQKKSHGLVIASAEIIPGFDREIPHCMNHWGGLAQWYLNNCYWRLKAQVIWHFIVNWLIAISIKSLLTEKQCQLKIRRQTAWASVCVVYNISGQSFRIILLKLSQAPSTVSLYFGSYDL